MPDDQSGRLRARYGVPITAVVVLCVGCGGGKLHPAPIHDVVTATAMPRIEEVHLAPLPPNLRLRPHNLAVTAQGDIAIWVKDDPEHWIRTLDTTGRVIATWGRPGEGPGEVRPGDLLLSDDSGIVIAGLAGQPVRAYDPQGALLVQRPSPPIGLPSPPSDGALIWWTPEVDGIGPHRSTPFVERRGPVTRWCIRQNCTARILQPDDPIVDTIDRAATPISGGLWPAFALRGDIAVFGDGYSYRLWRVDDRSRDSVVEFGRTLPPRMATKSAIAHADSDWDRLERTGVPGPHGKVRVSFDAERRFLKEHPLPRFVYMGLAFDSHGRLWVIGRDTVDNMFVDVFADTTYLGRKTIDCNRMGYAAAVRGHWFAAICGGANPDDEAFTIRLFRIVEPAAAPTKSNPG